MLKYGIVTKENIDLATKIQNTIFPNENGRKNFLDSIGEHSYRKELKFWIVYDEDTPIGITGLYSYHEYPTDAFLGWFGVLPEARGKGFGSQMFDNFENTARNSGYENIRLYTDELDNYEATKLYYKKGMISEEYTNEKDNIHAVSKILIFSKSIINKPTEKWNNKFLDLSGQEARQNYKNDN